VSIIQATDLEKKGLLNDQSSSLRIQGRWFKPGPAFTKSLRQIALEFCEDARFHGRQYLLIEFPTYFMAWRQIYSGSSTQSTQSVEVAEKSFTLFALDKTPPNHRHPRQLVQETQLSTSKAELSLSKTLARVNSAFIQRCKLELAIYIGPIADFLTEQALTQANQITPQDLIATLALHIPEAKAARAFQLTLHAVVDVDLDSSR